jgi:hypothetical protein
VRLPDPPRRGAIRSSSGYVSFSVNNLGAGVVDGVREATHAVVDELGISTCGCDELVDRATRWVDAALTVRGSARSGHASLRLSCSRGLLLVELTHDDPGTFDALMVDDATTSATEQLRAWARESGHALTIERGPRDQVLLTVVRQPTEPSVKDS